MAAFIEGLGNYRSIYTATNDGSGISKISGQPGHFNSAYVLPDGSKGVYAAQASDGFSQIFYLAPFSSEAIPLQLTTTPGHKTGAMLSADGVEITFMQERSGQLQPDEPSFDIALMNADGSDLHLLPLPAGWDYSHPFFSPDRTKITGAMGSAGCFDDCAVFIVNVDGSDFRRLTPGGEDGILAMSPAFSPDGKQIVFSSVGWADVGLYAINSDGSGLQHLSGVDVYFSDPLFVDDRILFVANDEIHSMKADGTDLNPVTDNPFRDAFEMSIFEI